MGTARGPRAGVAGLATTSSASNSTPFTRPNTNLSDEANKGATGGPAATRHVEQKNGMWPRQLWGYGRLEREELVEPIRALYAEVGGA